MVFYIMVDIKMNYLIQLFDHWYSLENIKKILHKQDNFLIYGLILDFVV